MSTLNGVMHVIPWEDMTPEQQADHLVYAHGYDRDWFDHPAMVTTADVWDYFLAASTASRGWLHKEDHDEAEYSGGKAHLHNKAKVC